ncbi:DUF2130 domain-containing protein [Parasediminibacterium paludis]|uniref:DUF2130 domain-containing protein n=1 Tax=Parasediminibacterium paludis TaxID=908966 RepID=A0ABV8PZP5_9BACT
MASFIITCPNCKHQFEPGDSMRDEIEKELRTKVIDWQKKKDEEFRNKEALYQQQLQLKDEEINKRLASEKQKLQAELQVQLTKSIAADFENQMKLLQQNLADNEEKLKSARSKELEFLQKEQALKNREQELELSVQKQLQQEREKLTEDIRKIEEQRVSAKEHDFVMKVKELEKQLDDQKKLAEEMRRKSEQGSMQLQGEVQELLLEELLQTTFPFDKVSEVGKGVRGADCIQTVRNQFGVEAGKIIYESKRTKDFGGDWIEKLKTDMRNLGADVAVIVTQTLPKGMERFGEKDGVYICTFTEVKSVALLLRNAILKIYDAKKSQENKGDKMVLLYDYLIGNEFNEQWKAIREGFMSMKLSIQRERDAMEKLWKAREKQLEKVLLNAAHIRGSIEGIAGVDAVNLNLLDEQDNLLLD